MEQAVENPLENAPIIPTTNANAVSTGLFGTPIPARAAFVVALVLFFLPFAEIRCNNMTLQSVTGLQLAIGFDLKTKDGFSNSIGDTTESESKGLTKKDAQHNDPNLLATAALIFAALGLGFSFAKTRKIFSASIIIALVGAGLMVALYLNIKDKVKLGSPDSGKKGSGIENFGDNIADNLNISIAITPWFFFCLLSFLAAAFFGYKWWKAGNQKI